MNGELRRRRRFCHRTNASRASPDRHREYLGSVPAHARFVVDTVALGQGFLRELGFNLSVSFHTRSVVIHSHTTDAVQS
jgi:hypothetical protein